MKAVPSMKAALQTLSLTAMALAVSSAFAQELQPTAPTTSGALGAGILGSRNNSSNPWKLKEYRDLDNGIITSVDVKRRAPDTYLDVFGENIGRDDQGIEIKGGRYNSYRYQIFDSRLTHNWTFGARSPYNGIGTNILTASFPNTNSNSWNTFDFRKKRENLGGMFEVWAGSPWFLRVDANEVRERGLQLIGGANGTNPGPGFVDKPFPIDYTTRNASIEAGYATRRAQFSVSLTHSRFDNDNEKLFWTNPGFASGQDTTWLPPSNNYTKLGANGMLKQLPFGSTLAGRLTVSQTTSTTAIPQTALTTGGALGATGADQGNFNGNVIHKTASLSLHSNWTRAVDSRIYWNWFRKDNESTQVTFVTPGTGLTCGATLTCDTDLLSYNKNNFGADVGYRVNTDNRLVFGADFVNLNRNRVDFDNTKDFRTSVEWRNTSLDWLGTRLKYQHLQRHSHFIESNAGVNSADAEFLNRFIRRFDAANVDQDLIKLGADLHTAEFTDFGIEAIWKNNRYKDTVLGRTRDDRAELYASAAYGDPSKLRFLLFGDFEYVTYDSTHRTVPGAGQNFDALSPPNATNFNWNAKNIDRSWLVGVGTDWLPRTALKVTASAIWQWTHGTADFTPQISPATPQVPITNFDNSRKFTLNLKGTYAVSKSLDLTAGYAYERFRYSDIAVDNYQYTIGASPNISYLSGAYAFPNYNANIAYLMATVKF
jgi:MtrB/PioB family decaheme-associated outer membrane protein